MDIPSFGKLVALLWCSGYLLRMPMPSLTIVGGCTIASFPFYVLNKSIVMVVDFAWLGYLGEL